MQMPNFSLIPMWQKAAAGLIVLALLLSLAYCQGRGDGRAKIEAENAKAVAVQTERNRKVQEDVAEQRVLDELANAKSKEEKYEVIASAPGGVVSPADRALACKRLRDAGYSGSNLPSECGPPVRH